jgi:F-type H+-transporting ATPase subunit c
VYRAIALDAPERTGFTGTKSNQRQSLKGDLEMEGDIALGLKYVGAGLATLGMIGAALGVGNIFASFLDAAMRNPSAAPQQTGNLFIGMALAEALGILAFLVSVLILFVV